MRFFALIIGAAVLFAGCAKLNNGVTAVGKCEACHAVPPAGAFHSVHVSTMHYSCSVCHAGVQGPDYHLPATHNNGVINVDITPPFPTADTGYFDAASQSCKMVYCHGAILATDSTTVSVTAQDTSCSFCHDIAQLQTKTHHTPAFITPAVFSDCGRCHGAAYNLAAKTVDSALHINGKIDPQTCTNSCHPVASPLADTVKDWGQTSCTICHATPPNDAIHTVHVDSMQYNCSICHPGNNGPGHVLPANHDNGTVDVAITLPYPTPKKGYYDSTTRSCNLVYCHGTIDSLDSTVVHIGDTVTGCSFCHSVSSLKTKAQHAYLPNELFQNCGFCHTGYNLNTQTVNKSLHINGAIDTGAIGSCTKCHDLPPADTVHNAHVGKRQYACGTCHALTPAAPLYGLPAAHDNAGKLVNVAITLPFPAATNPAVRQSGSYSNTTKSCNAVYCHGAILATDSSSVSQTASNTGCSFCHDIGQLQYKTHHEFIASTLFNNCSLCHAGYNDSTGTVDDTLHINGRIDPHTCTNSCHPGGSPDADTVKAWGQP